MGKMYAIFDVDSEEYFARGITRTRGWYSKNVMDARLYKSRKAASLVIFKGSHHVSYPGNRDLEVVELLLG